MESKGLNRIRTMLAWAGTFCGVACIALFGGRPAPTEAQSESPEDLPVYAGALAAGWQDWSWADHDLAYPLAKYQNKPTLRMYPAQFRGVFLHHDSFASKDYRAVTFVISGGKEGGQKIHLSLTDADSGNKFGTTVNVAKYAAGGKIPAGKFVTVTIPLKDLNPPAHCSGLCFQDALGSPQTSLYLADIRFLTLPRPPPKPLALEVDTTKIIGPIHAEIYGMAQPGPEHLAQLRLKLWRWGGNPATRYNWEKGNCWNASRDWLFRNGNYGNTRPEDRLPSGVVDRAIATGDAAGANALITIPTMGWVARDDNNATASENVPGQSGPPLVPGSSAIAGYDPTANRQRVSLKSWPRKGRPFEDPPDVTDDVVYQDEWVHHLTRRFGKANAGGVRYYAMDNEPDLWDATHTDMHPVRPNYDEILTQFLEYATAVKDVDPSAQITGPVSWGWTGYFYSPRDRGNDNFAAHADRMAHGDMPFLAWFLQQVAAHDKQTGRRTLDVLDVHYYPQGNGIYSGGTDAATNALRLRSTRALWDANYTDESWIGTQIQLLPRLRQWVDKYYPGTKIGLTEWNWGADVTMNGGLAVAEVLGILGREKVDLSCYWSTPGVGTPGFFAYKMYRNADNAGNGFGDIAAAASSTAPDRVSCFGSVDSRTGLPVVMLINKTGDEIAAPLHLIAKSALSRMQGFRYSSADLKDIAKIPDIVLKDGRASVILPPGSLTLLRGER